MLSTTFIKDIAPSVYKLEKRFGLVEKNFGLPSFDPREKGLLALKKTIVGQQLSTKAAKTIWERAEKFIIDHPLQNRNLENDLMDSGLSQKKCEYVKNILISNKLQKKKNYYKTIGAEGFTNLLISYKGIGPWTVDMAKMFFLGDVNVLPKGDLGIKRACNNFFPNEALDSIEEIYKPFNSYLSLNLWDSLD